MARGDGRQIQMAVEISLKIPESHLKKGE